MFRLVTISLIKSTLMVEYLFTSFIIQFEIIHNGHIVMLVHIDEETLTEQLANNKRNSNKMIENTKRQERFL